MFESRNKSPLELIYSNVCGPITPLAHNRYFLTLIDDYTYFTVVYLLKHESEALEHFKQFEAIATSHFKTKLLSLCCNNGREYF